MIKITGPHFRLRARSKTEEHASEAPASGAPSEARAKRKRTRRRKPWYLFWTTPEIDENGKRRRKKHRPTYYTREAAIADKARIEAQYNEAGSGEFLFDRTAATDYEAAKKIVGNVPMVEIARFWRLHHPEQPKLKIAQLYPLFLEALQKRFKHETRHTSDLRSRVGIYVAAAGEHYPDTITREDIFKYIEDLNVAARTARNHKQSICRFFNWLVGKGYITVNPAGGIKKSDLAIEEKNDIRFLKLDQAERYLRAAERYDPDMIPHEIVQLLAGVRADDEMANFKAEYVLLETKQVRVPSSISKMGEDDVIEGLEESFWTWWAAYGKEEGLLRVKNYEPRWFRIRVLATMLDQARADELARLPIKTLLRMDVAKNALADWPWNARRRTFCTYHVAKHQSADKTATLMRHQGGTATLWKSYRGLGVTQAKGVKYFEIQPWPVTHPIRPELPLRGIVRKQSERAQSMPAAASRAS